MSEVTMTDIEAIRRALEFGWAELDENGWLVKNPDPKLALDRIERVVEAARDIAKAQDEEPVSVAHEWQMALRDALGALDG